MVKSSEKIVAIVLVMAFRAFMGWLVFGPGEHEWSGVDETVIEKFAEEAGRSPVDPLINTDQGDLLLFVFLLAGVVGGFIGGYYFRELFPAKDEMVNKSETANKGKVAN